MTMNCENTTISINQLFLAFCATTASLLFGRAALKSRPLLFATIDFPLFAGVGASLEVLLSLVLLRLECICDCCLSLRPVHAGRREGGGKENGDGSET